MESTRRSRPFRARSLAKTRPLTELNALTPLIPKTHAFWNCRVHNSFEQPGNFYTMMTTLQLNRFRGGQQVESCSLVEAAGARAGSSPPARRDCDRGAHDVDRRRARDAAIGSLAMAFDVR
jgi:hypothetical protein